MNSPRSVCGVLASLILVAFFATPSPATDTSNILTYIWNGTARSDWINVTDPAYGASPNDEEDDSVAIQRALSEAGTSAAKRTVYIPSGTYNISTTLTWGGTGQAVSGVHLVETGTSAILGVTLVGSGNATTLKWTGSAGVPMFWSDGVSRSRYLGIKWDGSGSAGCAYLHMSAKGLGKKNSASVYETRVRHENEAFIGFNGSGTTFTGTYNFINGFGTAIASAVSGTFPAAGIVSGLSPSTSWTAEVMINNCLFKNCATGAIVGSEIANFYQWTFDGCEFEDCGTGIDLHNGKAIIMNDHFERSTTMDIYVRCLVSQTIRRCTSIGSKMFLTVSTATSPAHQVIQDCWIDSWSSTSGAISTGTPGPVLISDCVFSSTLPNPSTPIQTGNLSFGPGYLLLSNNYSPLFSEANLVKLNAYCTSKTIPPGMRGGSLTTPNTIFLNSGTMDETGCRFFPISPTWGAPGIEATIGDACNQGTGPVSVVYFPVGTYNLTTPLNISGSNCVIQGSGYNTILKWTGTYMDQPMLKITSPRNIRLEQFQLRKVSVAASTVPLIEQSGAGASDIVYDGVYSQRGNGGVRLELLPAGSRVYLAHLDTLLNINDCGAAEILAKNLQGPIAVGGAMQPRTGFLGVLNFQPGEAVNSGTYNPGYFPEYSGTYTGAYYDTNYWDVRVKDNQSLTIGHMYDEQGWQHLSASRDNFTGTGGHVTIMGVKIGADPGAPSAIKLQITDYSGRISYGPHYFRDPIAPLIKQTGTTSCDMIFPGISWASSPSVTWESGGHYAQICNILNTDPKPTCLEDIYENISEADAIKSTSAAFDDERQLGAYDLDWRYGIKNVLSNSMFERDTPTAAPRFTMGPIPQNWTVSGSTSYGNTVRNACVVGRGSPFSTGTQSVEFVDNTNLTVGTRLEFNQTFTSNANVGAVFTFDFCVNGTTGGSSPDFHARVLTSSGDAFQMRIIYKNGTPVLMGMIAGTYTALGSPLTFGKWYRVRIALPAPSSSACTGEASGGIGPVKVDVTPWGGQRARCQIDGAAQVDTSGFRKVSFHLVSPGKNTDINLDNISLVTGDPLFSFVGQ